MARWRTISGVLAIGLAAGSVSPLAPLAVAQNPPETKTEVTHSCRLEKPPLLAGARDQATNVSKETVTVRHPASVARGEVFTAYVQPGVGSMRTTDGRQAGLLSYDMAFPSNTTNLRARLVGGGTGYSIPGNAPASVDRIADSGERRPDGQFVRIHGGADAMAVYRELGPHIINKWKAGMTVGANQSFAFPEVALTMRAPVSLAAGASIKTALKAAGESGSSADAAKNTIQGAEEGGWGIERTNYFFCGSSANAAELSSTIVDASKPVRLAQTSTSMITGDSHLPDTEQTIPLVAEVETNDELMSNVQDATMTFVVKDKASGRVVETHAGALVDASGRASVNHTFALSGDQRRAAYEVTARYEGIAGDIAASISEPTTISIGFSELPEGGQGSVSLEEFFRAPQLVWDWLTGSIGQAGTFSVSFGE